MLIEKLSFDSQVDFYIEKAKFHSDWFPTLKNFVYWKGTANKTSALK